MVRATNNGGRMATPGTLRDSEIAKIRELLSHATSDELDANEHLRVDKTLLLLSKRDNLQTLVGRMLSDAIPD